MPSPPIEMIKELSCPSSATQWAALGVAVFDLVNRKKGRIVHTYYRNGRRRYDLVKTVCLLLTHTGIHIAHIMFCFPLSSYQYLYLPVFFPYKRNVFPGMTFQSLVGNPSILFGACTCILPTPRMRWCFITQLLIGVIYSLRSLFSE